MLSRYVKRTNHFPTAVHIHTNKKSSRGPSIHSTGSGRTQPSHFKCRRRFIGSGRTQLSHFKCSRCSRRSIRQCRLPWLWLQCTRCGSLRRCVGRACVCVVCVAAWTRQKPVPLSLGHRHALGRVVLEHLHDQVGKVLVLWRAGCKARTQRGPQRAATANACGQMFPEDIEAG